MYYTARQLAMNNGREYHLAAILRRGKNIVKIGENTFKTHPRFTRTFPSGVVSSHMHAEMNVLRFAKPGDIIEVMRFRKGTDEPTMAKPCKHCMKFLREAEIKLVRYTNWAGEWEVIYP